MIFKNEKTTERERRHCASCGRPLQLGSNCLRLIPGVIGPRGIIDLEDEPHLYCDQDCLGERVRQQRFDPDQHLRGDEDR